MGEWFGFSGSIGAYLVDAQGVVRFTIARGGLIAQLERAIADMQSGKPLEKTKTLSLGKPIALPADSKSSEILQKVIDSESGLSVLIMTNADKNCDSCTEISNSIKSNLKNWQSQGINAALIDISKSENSTFDSNTPIIADPGGDLVNTWGYQSLPQAIILNRGKYAGTIPFSELTFTKKALSGEVIEQITTKAPFVMGITKSIEYVKKKESQ